MSHLPPPHPPIARRSNITLLLVMFFGILIGWEAFRWKSDDPSLVAAKEPRVVTPRGDLADDEKANIDLFKHAGPSVVFITTLARQRALLGGPGMEVEAGTGSGFFWDDVGHVVTNFHVLKDANAAKITLSDQSTYPADLVGVAPNQDLAVLRIDAPKEKLAALAVGTSHDLQVGQRVYAIGNPFGLDQTLTTGIVSALGRAIPAATGRTIDQVIQTDASINPGNSGGPLLDSSGRLIGVNTAIFSPSGTSAGIGFAIPVDTVNRVVPQLIKNGRVTRPEIGLALNDRYSQVIMPKLGVQGVLIVGILPDSPAERVGIKPTVQDREGRFIFGDILQAIDGQPITSSDIMYRVLQRFEPGQTVSVRLWRDGKTRDVKVKLGDAVD